MDDVKQWYNQNLERYLQTGDVLLRGKLDSFLEHVPIGGKILDIGSGTGRDVDYFTRSGREAIGIDFSEKMIGHARSWALGDFHLLNMTDIDFEKGTFDGVWDSSALFTHNLPPKRSDILKKLYGITKGGGILGTIARKKRENEQKIVNMTYNTYSQEEIVAEILPFWNPVSIETFIYNEREWFFILSLK